MTITGLHHAQITIEPQDEDRARDFYIGLLGLSEIPKPDVLAKRGGFWVRLANADVHVSLESDVDRTRTKVHLAYQVEDVAVWRERLTGHVTFEDTTPIPGFDRIQFRDPFGNRVEMIQPLPEQTE